MIKLAARDRVQLVVAAYESGLARRAGPAPRSQTRKPSSRTDRALRIHRHHPLINGNT